LTDCLHSVPWRIHLDFIYTTWLLSLYNSSNWLLSLYILTSWLQRLYLANFIYLNNSLTSTWAPTWHGLQSWTLFWLNFFLNSVFKLHQILWSFPWLRLHDLNQLKLLIFILLGLDLNWVLYLGILLPRTALDLLLQLGLTLFIWLRFNFISYLNQSCINLMFLCTKRSLTWSKEVSLSRTFFLLGLLTQVFTRIFPEIVPDTLSESPPELYPSVLLGALPESYPDTYPIGLTQPYSSAYLAG
jgi:hypothetical protein